MTNPKPHKPHSELGIANYDYVADYEGTVEKKIRCEAANTYHQLLEVLKVSPKASNLELATLGHEYNKWLAMEFKGDQDSYECYRIHAFIDPEQKIHLASGQEFNIDAWPEFHNPKLEKDSKQ